MMKQFQYVLTLLFIATLSACGSLPDVDVGYYLPKTTLNLTATQSAKCLPPEKKGGVPRPFVLTNVEFSPAYSADINRGLQILNVEDFEGVFSKGHFEIVLTDDGRLQSFGTEGTSQISEGLKTVVDLVSLGFGADFLQWKSSGFAGEQDEDRKKAFEEKLKKENAKLLRHACNELKSMANKAEILSVVRSGQVQFEKVYDDEGNYAFDGIDLEIRKINIGEKNFKRVADIFGEIEQGYNVETNKEGQLPYKSNAKEGKHNRITLVEPERGMIKIDVKRLAKPDDWVRDIFTTKILVPQFGTTYDIEVPKVPTFGSVGTSFTIAENGKLTKLKYTSDSGAASAQAAIGTIQGLKKEDEATDPIAAAKAQSDLIYQQQRLIICQSDPANCPG